MTIDEMIRAAVEQSNATLEESRQAIRENIELGMQMLRTEAMIENDNTPTTENE